MSDQTPAVTVASLSTGSVTYQMALPDAGSDYIQSMLATGKLYEGAMLEDIAMRLEPGQLVLDIGANIGSHSCYLAARGIHVVAFEPDPHLAAALQHSIALNNFENRMEVRTFALGSTPGPATLLRPDSTNLGSQFIRLEQTPRAKDEPAEAAFETTVLTVDQQAYPGRVAAVKIDVEGMEIDVLDGAALLLEQDRPIVYVEALSSEQFEQVYERLGQIGYRYRSTFNFSPTHLFVPGDAAADRATLESTAILARRMYLAEESLSATRAHLTSANARYRSATELIATLRSEPAGPASAGTASPEEVAQRENLLRLLEGSHRREIAHADRLIEVQEALQARETELRKLIDSVEASRGSATDLDEAREKMLGISRQRDALVERLARASDAAAQRRRHAVRARRTIDSLHQELARTTEEIEVSRGDLNRQREAIEHLGTRLVAEQEVATELQHRLLLAEQRSGRDNDRFSRSKADMRVLRDWIREAQDRERRLEATINLLSHGEGLDRAEAGAYVPAATLRQTREEADKLQRQLDHAHDSAEAAKRYRDQLIRLRGSKTYRLGKALREGLSSFRGFLRMPMEILAILREGPASETERADHLNQRKDAA